MSFGFDEALKIAVEAHTGQKDRLGLPYLEHVIRVAMSVPAGELRLTALLHDVLEDCPDWEKWRLEFRNVPSKIVNAIVALTRDPEKPYMEYIETVIAAGEPAIIVKLADLEDHLSLTRRAGLTDAQLKRYNVALTKLLDASIYSNRS